jgi:cytochrome c oxidase assembly protein subunit 11
MSETPQTPQEPDRAARSGNARALRRTVLPLVLIVGGMTGLAFAAVPLYDMFCRVTGYGGTTQRADAGADRVLDRTITIRFDASTSSKLDWAFKPAQTSMKVRIGESALAVFEARNRSDNPVTGTATYNVTPEIAGYYFRKVQCFCFTKQRLEPGQHMDMPVSFFVDPEIVDDPDARNVDEITLSYTFFQKKQGGERDSVSADRQGKDRGGA